MSPDADGTIVARCGDDEWSWQMRVHTGGMSAAIERSRLHGRHSKLLPSRQSNAASPNSFDAAVPGTAIERYRCPLTPSFSQPALGKVPTSITLFGRHAVCDLRAPQEGQKPRHFQLKANNLSWQHSPQRNLRKPCARMPHSKKGVELLDEPGS